MKRTLKLTLLISFLALLSSTKIKAQSYATLDYWGKDIKLDRSFFQILNNQWSYFLNNQASQWRYYDYGDYTDIYNKTVQNLTRSDFKVQVTESNSLWFYNISNDWPSSTEENKNKKNRARAGWVQHYVLLPALQEFAKGKI
ncbi:hypothetical protein [Solitalea lacus]|uniref:hypothetical protein n=1 Tax=Solitalea lacus TaxID=2911172 RepID=UPI001EDBFAF9|nr:hypothetical protein [Solitalea lacus]UKJ07787.1 hypothetical protein L2B55_01155 [Solitalea lacus]